MKKLTEEELQARISKAASMMGKLSAIKKPKTKEFMSQMGKKGMASRWGKKDPLDN
jgi:hypothetical protein